MTGDFSLIVDPYLWKLLKDEDGKVMHILNNVIQKIIVNIV